MPVLQFFRIRKPKQFSYKPLYYDPLTEAREEREKRINLQTETNDMPEGGYPERIKGSMRTKKVNFHRHNLKKDARTSNLRLIIIIIILSFLTWYFIFK